MGCSSTKQMRPLSARSWMANDGWLTSNTPTNVDSPRRTGSGRIQHEDKVHDHTSKGSEPKPNLEESRHTGDYALGVADETAIAKKLESLNGNALFIDDEFPPEQSSLFCTEKSDPDIKWMRPKDLVKTPKMLIDGESKSDIMQGSLADCWFLSSCAALAEKKNFINKIVPENQALYGTNYKGVVKFTFWRFGKWVDVFIDDLLPVKDGQLIYARNSDPNEFWVPLLEKAYAKLHGSYEAIEGGQSMDALVDLTGGIAERYELVEHTQELYQKLARAIINGAFVACSRKGDWKSQSADEVDEFGLVSGHAYTVTDVKRLKRKQGNECLLRVRNPWGNGKEWSGAWCDGDHRWKLLDQETKDRMHYFEKDDGEFWISYKDFCQQFQEVTICTIGPDFDGDGVADKSGYILNAHGEWVIGKTAGGCRNDIKSFDRNPQYLLTVEEYDDSEDHVPLSNDSEDGTASVVITLMQEHRRSQRHLGLKMLQIGFIAYYTDEFDDRLNSEHFLYNYEIAKSGPYVNFREVSGRFELPVGQFVLIPSTYNKDEAGSFLIRVYCNKKISLKQLPEYSD